MFKRDRNVYGVAIKGNIVMIYVDSKIGVLEKVIIHTPGYEIEDGVTISGTDLTEEVGETYEICSSWKWFQCKFLYF